MDPLNNGDNGALGSVFDTITGTVNSIEGFGRTVGEATTFSMSVAMIWAVILFMFISLFARLFTPWNTAAADRWRQTGHVIAPAKPYGRRRDPRDDRIQELEDQIAALAAQLAALTTGEDPPEIRETGT